nr:hypothetical protein [Candidatus Njordarchaeota archaeon]
MRSREGASSPSTSATTRMSLTALPVEWHYFLYAHLPKTMIAITHIIVTPAAVNTKTNQPTHPPVPVVSGIPAVAKAHMTTYVRMKPMTMPNAVPKDVAIVDLISSQLNPFSPMSLSPLFSDGVFDIDIGKIVALSPAYSQATVGISAHLISLKE